MRWSRFFCPTLKEVPREAEVISHQLMLRAGFIRKTASGLYTYLPLGLRVLRKLEAIIRDEMTSLGAQEVMLPLLTPESLWQETGRWDKYGDELLRVRDRHGNTFCYGPTFEEAITDVCRQNVQSYKSLPLCLFQIQNKFRDEIRPRFGLMRGREFVMKDAYSFHIDHSDLQRTYNDMIAAYGRIFSRCGLNYKVVQADNGDIGGDVSAEFMVTAETGEDEVLFCNACGTVANVDASASVFSGASVGDMCVCGEASIERIRGIEVGHVFQLGDTYSSAMGAEILDQNGRRVAVQMGCYGIGVSRTMAAAIEQHHDDKGMRWPLALAPFDVTIIVARMKDDALLASAERLYTTLIQAGIDVLYDDRHISPGIKFKDADIVGIPIHVVLGRSWQERGEYEMVARHDGKRLFIKEADVVQYLLDWKTHG